MLHSFIHKSESYKTQSLNVRVKGFLKLLIVLNGFGTESTSVKRCIIQVQFDSSSRIALYDSRFV